MKKMRRGGSIFEIRVRFYTTFAYFGGFAAYQGDRVGMIVGKRKLSLFGIRPRYFSRIVSVVTGIVIVMITMGGVLLISDTAQKAIFGIEALQSDSARLNSQVNELSELQERLNKENELLRAQNEALHAENAELSAIQAELAAANAELRSEQEMLEAILEELEGRFDTLQVSGAWMWEILLQTPLVYEYGELIGNYVVAVTDDREQVTAEVERVLAEVNETLWAGVQEIRAPALARPTPSSATFPASSTLRKKSTLRLWSMASWPYLILKPQSFKSSQIDIRRRVNRSAWYLTSA